MLYEACSLGSVETSSKSSLKHNHNFLGNLISIQVATIKVKKNWIFKHASMCNMKLLMNAKKTKEGNFFSTQSATTKSNKLEV
jgi:hypothetical protein